MAGLFDSVLIPSVGSTPTSLYQPLTDGVAMSCLLTNASAGSLPLSSWIQRGADVIDLSVAESVEAGVSLDIFKGSKVALKAGDTVYASCPVAGAFSGILSAYKDQ